MSKIGPRTGVVYAVVHLIETAQSHGRDWKLVAAVLAVLTTFVAETTPEELAVRLPPKLTGGHPGADGAPSARSRRTRSFPLSKQQKDRLRAVIDSLSDDEAAHFLGVGVQQVRRRASAGQLYAFTVGGKKRYPLWQFADRSRTLPGLRETIRAIPSSWSPERVQRFMTLKQGPKLDGKRVSPVTWLLRGGDPERLANILASSSVG
ncbi:hypothetical protein SAMN06295974_1308 [Plantibacter flavus]|uniref:DNA-binding protein n=1 Tax=Plantibacter flavus TaxID=150123 RepID=A0A3N2C6V4_9MICO|nr:hypothetical protein EDD42_3353 [Plantibacter flavus]SMG21843.1 hypothetical protein SAMN06295974_1308 [Plantibacter flavus]